MKFTLSPKVKSLIIKASKFVAKPITIQPVFFLLLYVLFNVLDIYSLSVIHFKDPLFHGPWLKIAYGFILCYLLLLPVIVLPSKMRVVYKVAVMLFAIAFFAIDLYLLYLYDETFNTICIDAIAALLATNPQEATEFVNAYFAVDVLVAILFIISLLLALFYYLNRIVLRWNFKKEFFIFAFMLISLIVSVAQFEKIIDTNFYYLITAEYPDLREYRQNPEIVSGEQGPEKVVLIIGESFVKTHSSLYGYEKTTNPLLAAMRNDSSLFVYKNVTSYAMTTIPAVKSLITAYTEEMGDSIEWFQCLTLLEVMQKSGYKTSWLSNQSKRGFHDNEVGRFSELCDEAFYAGDEYSGRYKYDLDEGLFPYLDSCLNRSVGKHFIVIQLMGSHTHYEKRYPATSGKFVPGDYDLTHQRLSDKNRQIIAHYDNTVLYNDSIVYEMMNRFSGDDAAVIYLSDHGQDVFESSNDFAGHARFGSEVSAAAARNIPLMIYTTPLFKEKHGNMQELIEQSVDKPYRSDSIMYTVMDLVGIDSVNGVSYKHKSLFR